jgi:RNA polymerase sigma-70 factor, ECF subfamily
VNTDGADHYICVAQAFSPVRNFASRLRKIPVIFNWLIRITSIDGESVMGPAVACEAEMVDESDEQSLETAYRHFSWRIYGLCRHLLGSHDAARDAAQEVFLRVQEARQQIDQKRPPENWLLSIARNYCLDQLRRRKTEQRLFSPAADNLPEPASSAPSPLVRLLAIESKAAFRLALERLPARSREILLLRYECGMSYQAISELLGISRSDVGVLIFRAKEQLRRILQPARKEFA